LLEYVVIMEIGTNVKTVPIIAVGIGIGIDYPEPWIAQSSR
jgi:hypothetical protein